MSLTIILVARVQKVDSLLDSSEVFFGSLESDVVRAAEKCFSFAVRRLLPPETLGNPEKLRETIDDALTDGYYDGDGEIVYITWPNKKDCDKG